MHMRGSDVCGSRPRDRVRDVGGNQRRLSRLAAITAAAALIVAAVQLLALPSVTASTPIDGGAFVAMTSTLGVNATGTGSGAFGAGETRTYSILGHAGVPATGVSAVLVSIGVLDTTATSSGFVTAWNSDTSRPAVPTVFFSSTSAPRSNTAILRVGSDGSIDLYNNAGTTDLAVMIEGYFTSDGSGASGVGNVVTVSPTEVLNTTDGTGSTEAQVPAGGSVDFAVGGIGDVPTDATSVFADVEVRNATASGQLKVGPGGAPITALPSITYDDDGPLSTTASLTLASDGTARVTNSGSQSVDLVVSIESYVTSDPDATAAYVPVGGGLVYSTLTAGNTALQPGETRAITVYGTGGVPNDPQVEAVALSVSVRNWTASGEVDIYDPDDDDSSDSTAIPFAAGTGDPTNGLSAFTMVGVSDAGTIDVHNTSSQTINVAFAAEGWFAGQLKPTGDDTDPVTYTPSPSNPTVAPDSGPPTVSGTVTNGDGNPQAGVTVQITDPDEVDTVPQGTTMTPTVLGTATTGANGQWTFTLPSTLPADIQTLADGNGGILNLEADADGMTSDGTYLNAVQLLSTGVATGSATTEQSDAARAAGDDTTANTAAFTPLAANTASPDNNADPSGSDDWANSEASKAWDDASAAYPAQPTIQSDDGSSVSNYSPETLNGIDYSPAENVKRGWGCGTAGDSVVHKEYDYTRIGEAHAFWDVKVGFTFTSGTAVTIGAAYSTDFAKDFVSLSSSYTTETSGSGSPYWDPKGPFWAHIFVVPMWYEKDKITKQCPGAGGTYVFYVIQNDGFDVSNGVEVLKPGANVRYQPDANHADGAGGWDNANHAWRFRIGTKGGFVYSVGKTTSYGLGVTAFGIGLNEDSDYGSSISIDEHAQGAHGDHDLWCTSGLADGPHCGIMHSD